MESQILANLVNILAIILSIVSLLITVIGFFASLKFYRDGVKLQGLANDALIRIEEKAQSIQTQVGGMFDKTLDAAIGKSEKLESNFEALNQQLEDSAKAILDTAQKKLGAAGEEERKKLETVVAKQMSIVRKRVEATRDTAAEVVESNPAVSPLSSYKESILVLLNRAKEPVTINYIARTLGITVALVSILLNSLLQSGHVIKNETGESPTYRTTKKWVSLVLQRKVAAGQAE